MAPELLDRAIEAHGGLGRFQATDEVVVDLACGGFALTMRFQRGALAGITGRVSTKETRVTIEPYPDEGRRGVLEGESVRIESDDGTVLERRDDPRAAFGALRRKFWWDDLDLLYFSGYALWNYMSTPFLFARPGFVARELDPWDENGERWRRLHVTFPADVPTHSREQDFYFDDSGRLRRLDYTAEVFGGWAKAAHYCFDHHNFDGLLIPTRRRVYPRRPNNRPRARPTLVWIDVKKVELV